MPQLARHARLLALDRLAELVGLIGGQFINAGENDQIGFFELLAEDVGRLGREARLLGPLQNPLSVAGLEDHGIRGDLETSAVQLHQRLNDGGRQIGATADRLGQDHVGPPCLLEPADGVDQLVEVATEARAGHFAHQMPLRS